MTEPGPAPSASTGEFRLDLDAAEDAIRALEGVKRQIEAARDQAVTLAKTPPTVHDAVSLEAYTLLAQKADGGPGSFTAAMDAGLAHVDDLIDQMRADIAEQRELDNGTATGLPRRA